MARLPHRLTAQQARRIALHAQTLTATRPAGIVEAVDTLTVVNIDPTAAVAPSADHILWSRIGWPYQSSDLARAVEVDRAVFEWAGFYRPMTDLALYLPMMRVWPPSRRQADWLEANAAFRRDVLARLRVDGPLRTGQIDDTSHVAWASSGWTNERNVSQMLDFLVMRGEVAISGREGRDRLWDLSERVYPADVPELTYAAAAAERAHRRLGALGIARAKDLKQPVEPIDVGNIGEEAIVEGVEGSWRIDRGILEHADMFEPRTALLSPFDRLVFDRRRAQEIFGFDYIVEMYKPAHKRRWGYFALPILHGDELVGKLDAKADRTAGLLRVTAVHEDEPFSEATSTAVHAEIDQLAAWLGFEVASAAQPTASTMSFPSKLIAPRNDQSSAR